jgi:hypothetical protein
MYKMKDLHCITGFTRDQLTNWLGGLMRLESGIDPEAQVTPNTPRLAQTGLLS